MERRIALCVSQWSADSTLYAWSFSKQYFLRKQRDASGTEVLSKLDKLYVVHVIKDSKKEKEKKDAWCAGGPLLPGMRVALAKFPHQVVELEAQSVHAALLEFAANEGIDIMILGSKENKGTVQKLVAPGGITNSTSDTVKSKCKCPCLIIRPASARNEKMRIKSNINLGALLDAEARGMHNEGAINARLKAINAPLGGNVAASSADEVRRVCLAFESVEVGQHMLAWATKYCLFPDDEVYIVHCFSKSLMKLANKRGNEVGPEIVDEVESESINVVSNTQLKEDPKHGLCGFLEEKSIDLVIAGSATTSRLRKTLNQLQLGQASLSTHLLHHAPCPTLVIPYKSVASEYASPFHNDTGQDPVHAPADAAAAAAAPAEGPEASPVRPNSAQLSRRNSYGSPAGPQQGAGQYPLTIVSDDDEGPADGAPSGGGGGGAGGAKFGRAASLRVALQSWRSIRAALGDRPGSSPSPAVSGSNGAEHEDHAAPQQEGSRRTSRSHHADYAAKTLALQQRVDEQDIEVAALREQVRRLQLALDAARRPAADVSHQPVPNSSQMPPAQPGTAADNGSVA